MQYVMMPGSDHRASSLILTDRTVMHGSQSTRHSLEAARVS